MADEDHGTNAGQQVEFVVQEHYINAFQTKNRTFSFSMLSTCRNLFFCFWCFLRVESQIFVLCVFYVYSNTFSFGMFPTHIILDFHFVCFIPPHSTCLQHVQRSK